MRETQDSEVVGRLGSTVLRLGQIGLALALHEPAEQRRIAASADALDRFARRELVRLHLLHAARAAGWHERSDVRNRMSRASADALISSYVESQSEPPDAYPDEAAIEQFYELNHALFTTHKALRFAQIYLPVSGDATFETQSAIAARAAELARLAAAPGAGFAALARAYSQHVPSAEQGGDMGWVAEKDLLPEIHAAAVNLSLGAIAGPVRTGQGWHVLRLLNQKAAMVQPLEDVAESIAHILRLNRAREIEAAQLEARLRENPVVLDAQALARLGT